MTPKAFAQHAYYTAGLSLASWLLSEPLVEAHNTALSAPSALKFRWQKLALSKKSRTTTYYNSQASAVIVTFRTMQPYGLQLPGLLDNLSVVLCDFSKALIVPNADIGKRHEVERSHNNIVLMT